MARIVFTEKPAKTPEPVEPVAVREPMSDWLARWITCFCRDGEGSPIVLTVEQQQLLRLLFDGPSKGMFVVEGILAPCLALSALCGPTQGDTHLQFATNNEEMRSVASPELRAALDRDAQGRISYGGKWPILTT